jgi:hypothetical protein
MTFVSPETPNLPQGLKPRQNFILNGTAEAVPFHKSVPFQIFSFT